MSAAVDAQRERRHTLHFLAATRRAALVHLDSEVDATALLADRAADPRPASVVTYAVQAVGRVLARHPEANAAHGGGLRQTRRRHRAVDVKLTLDKRVGGTRVVLSAVLPDADAASRSFLQARVERLRDAEATALPELAGARALARLPVPLGRVAFALATRPAVRHRRLGTVAVTSLGHRRVQRFHSHGGTAVTVGLGRITDRAVVRGGAVVVAPVLPLSLTFDHRVVDGALAADVLDDLVRTLSAAPEPAGATR